MEWVLIIGGCTIFFFWVFINGVIEGRIDRISKEKIASLEHQLRSKIDYERAEMLHLKEVQDKLFEEKTKDFPHVAKLFTLYTKRMAEHYEECLRIKKSPALKAAETVKKLGKRLQDIEEKYYVAMGKVNRHPMQYSKNMTEDKVILDLEKIKDDHLKELFKMKKNYEENERILKEKLRKRIKNSRNSNLELEKKDDLLFKKEQELNKREEELISKEILINQKEQEINSENEQKIQTIEKLLEEKIHAIPWLAIVYAEYSTMKANAIAEMLETKRFPAIKSAEAIREFSKRTKEAEKKYLTVYMMLKYYEEMFPDVIDLEEIEEDQTSQDEEDFTQELIEHEEWKRLSPTEQHQKSLERYCNRKKSKCEIGREYERFIGHEYELQGWKVKYFGIIKGFEDLGRDLIAQKGGETQIIQCKYWANNKTIHEKHIFQLYGTTIVYQIENRLLVQPKAVFITSCNLSETAQKVAEYLRIDIIQNKPMLEYPRIKCNISKDGEKIYHLPFDQQYDKICINIHDGEFYCMKIVDAEKAGFRRAYRWRGN